MRIAAPACQASWNQFETISGRFVLGAQHGCRANVDRKTESWQLGPVKSWMVKVIVNIQHACGYRSLYRFCRMRLQAC